MERLLIVAPNWLGDAVMALPAIAGVRRGLPGARLAIAARPTIAPLFTLAGDVDEIIALGADGISPRSAFDAALLLPNSFRSTVMVTRAGIAERWGYRGDCRRLLLTRAVARPTGVVHQVDYYRHLVHALGFSDTPAAPRLEAPAGGCTAAGEVLRQNGWDRRAPLVALAPGAAGGSAKRWPAAAFADVARGLAGDGIAIAVIGTSTDASVAAELIAALPARSVIDLVGKTDLATLAGVLVNCRALVANDSGAMHLAAALGVPVVALFGPTDERQTSPRGEVRRRRDQGTVGQRPDAATRPDHVVLTHDVWCRPCKLRTCPIDHRCMRRIPPSAVVDAARQMV